MYELLPTQRALLVWQADLRPDEQGGGLGSLRDHHAVGELVRKKSGRVSFRYFDDLEAACAQGFRDYPGLFTDMKAKANDRIGFELLRRRLPPEQRRDYGKILQTFGLPEDLDLSDHLTLMAYTGARNDDDFSICETFDGFDRPFRFLFDLANVKRDGTYDVCAKLAPGEALTFKREPDSPHGPNAVKVVRAANEKEKAGYVNHLQAEAVGRWLDEGEITASAFMFSGRSVYPRLYVNVNVIPCVAAQQEDIREDASQIPAHATEAKSPMPARRR